MAISQEMLMKKIKEEVAHAEQHIHTDQFSVYIGKLHVLCELVLEQSNTYEEKEQITMAKSEGSNLEQRAPNIQKDNSELLKGDSIFDF